MKLISACLCGINCKYNGGNNFDPYFFDLWKNKQLIPVCPEELGGLSTPRCPAEIIGGSGEDVLRNQARVIDATGNDLSPYFVQGAYRALELARLGGVRSAILKSRSPSCGAGSIYDGSFNSRLRSGDGVSTALLKQNGIKVISDEDFDKV
ncbi:MAG: DUF523 domain-containing protein [Syntrophomonas sp.]|uniref:DUF523 domain-containing protein n=1 Tax=Syntrophomonas sp. TaxID=2053627 RepID=UPI002612097F|nr:DUF523 domain-containing protein [Syntrophomonas sp.]MDD2509782.1 DUF523 domain-containing protein [Syntrophomonas sp.]MDD3878890.1 DUF523 domain-containing protein [Syntrophomonas sp.]MDD4625725.1 DUF523 domain-containing protein [Syntrophomonas sp.]